MRTPRVRRSVLDSYAVLAYLFKEKGHEKVVAALEKAAESDKPLLVVAPNWAEVCYQVERKVGAEAWARTREKLLGLPIEIVPADQELAEQAGRNQGAPPDVPRRRIRRGPRESPKG